MINQAITTAKALGGRVHRLYRGVLEIEGLEVVEEEPIYIDDDTVAPSIVDEGRGIYTGLSSDATNGVYMLDDDEDEEEDWEDDYDEDEFDDEEFDEDEFEDEEFDDDEDDWDDEEDDYDDVDLDDDDDDDDWEDDDEDD